MRFICILPRTFADITALKPNACIVIRGVIATIATTPKASVRIWSGEPPFSATHAPTISGSIKLEVKGPLATPPESKAIAVYILGTKNESPKDIRYPGIR